MSYPETEVLNSLVARVFRIEDVTLGDPARGMLARYRGELLQADTEAAYDQLAHSLQAYGITPLFRMEQGKPVIFLVPRKPEGRPARPSVNIVLFVLTVFSVMFVGMGEHFRVLRTAAGSRWILLHSRSSAAHS